MSLEESVKEVRIEKIHANTFHLVKKIVKIGPVDPEIIWLNFAQVEKEEITEVKYIARSASLPSGLN